MRKVSVLHACPCTAYVTMNVWMHVNDCECIYYMIFYACMYVLMYALSKRFNVCTCITCVCGCVSVCTCECVCVRENVHVHIYICIICKLVSMYIYIHIIHWKRSIMSVRAYVLYVCAWCVPDLCLMCACKYPHMHPRTY